MLLKSDTRLEFDAICERCNALEIAWYVESFVEYHSPCRGSETCLPRGFPRPADVRNFRFIIHRGRGRSCTTMLGESSEPEELLWARDFVELKMRPHTPGSDS